MSEQLVKIKILAPFRGYAGGEEVQKRADLAARYVADGVAEYVPAEPNGKKPEPSGQSEG